MLQSHQISLHLGVSITRFYHRYKDRLHVRPPLEENAIVEADELACKIESIITYHGKNQLKSDEVHFNNV